MIRACIFDMDGVLIDTEPVWRRVEREVFSRVGIDLSDEQLRETWGKRIEEVVDHWYRVRPWDGVRPRAVQKEIIRRMVDYARSEGIPIPGAVDAVHAARNAGLRVGIASSSSRDLIDAVVQRLDIAHLVDGVCTADDEVMGKPDPGVYLSAARLLEAEPAECIAVEDSPAGVRSAKSAGMVCIAVRTDTVHNEDLSMADLTLDSLHEFTADLLSTFGDDEHVSVTGRRGS
ncbi:MAG: hexitol phosphatase HxpB [Candidatus Dormibacteraeota bacterium]|nr:hexitol phosphatase HxpB [Candidatus Dormibacteraeota bacterium]MBV9525283.1 hexitol phosphatase HxpB [Candidatus Dormibacteraeota bacterium]